MSEEINYMEGYIASHSFRAGMVSVMARLGYSEEQIKIQGRWSSDAFRRYLKLGRGERLESQFELAQKIATLVGATLHRDTVIA